MAHSLFAIEIGKELKQARINKKLTQLEVAARLGVERSTISNYEAGTRSIEIETFCKLCELFNVEPQEIYDKCRRYLYR